MAGRRATAPGQHGSRRAAVLASQTPRTERRRRKTPEPAAHGRDRFARTFGARHAAMWMALP
jgi:hypothetical protein